jgi:hypothetical protein
MEMPEALSAVISESPDNLASAMIEENNTDIGTVRDIVMGRISKNNLITRMIFTFLFISRSASEKNCCSIRINVKKIKPVKNG